jgi:hypothetical protein
MVGAGGDPIPILLCALTNNNNNNNNNNNTVKPAALVWRPSLEKKFFNAANPGGIKHG